MHLYIMNNYIVYISGGLLGDFIHQLSVINEIWIKTGKKGKLYIANIGDNFRNGLNDAYEQTHGFVIKQDYIENYNLYNGESYDINLSLWRNHKHLYNISLIQNFKETYQIEWGKHKWLNYIENDNAWSDKIVINTTHYRFPTDLNFESIKTNKNIIYVSIIKNEYEFFKNKSGIELEYYCPKSLSELCVIINSCKMFIGSLSAPLSITTALHKTCVYGGTTNEKQLFLNFDKDLSFISYSI